MTTSTQDLGFSKHVHISRFQRSYNYDFYFGEVAHSQLSPKKLHRLFESTSQSHMRIVIDHFLLLLVTSCSNEAKEESSPKNDKIVAPLPLQIHHSVPHTPSKHPHRPKPSHGNTSSSLTLFYQTSHALKILIDLNLRGLVPNTQMPQ